MVLYVKLFFHYSCNNLNSIAAAPSLYLEMFAAMALAGYNTYYGVESNRKVKVAASIEDAKELIKQLNDINTPDRDRAHPLGSV